MRKRLLLIAVVLLLAVPLVLLLKDLTRKVVLVELLRFAWAVRILFESLPQILMWLLLLVVVLLIAVRSLIRQPKPSKEAPEAGTDHLGQIRVLTRRIARASEGEYFRWDLARYLGKLTLDVLAYRQHTTPEQLRQRLRTGSLSVPPEVQVCLKAGFRPAFSASTNLLSRLRSRLSSSIQPSALDPSPEKMVRFLEDQLEVHHDKSP